MKPQVRWLIRRDYPEVLEIEVASFDSPWGEEEFLLAARHRNCIGMVAERDHEVVGFMIYELHKVNLRILNFAVHPSHRHCGVGRAMVRRLIEKLSQQRRTSIDLHVGENNLDGQLFFRACGFRACEVIRGFYEESGDDAYRMVFTEQDAIASRWEPRNRIGGLK